MHPDLKKYISLVDFIADVMGEDTEVILHDVTNLENSVIAIRNNHISGREIGAPPTDLALKILKKSESSEIGDFLANYKGVSKLGLSLKSSTYFIKDNSGRKIIGMLCINQDIDKYITLKKTIDKVIGFSGFEYKYQAQEDNSGIVENFSQSINDLTLRTIRFVVDDIGILPERMSPEEKIDAVRKMYNEGIFLIKGATKEAADALKVSEATVYRYLAKIKSEMG